MLSLVHRATRCLRSDRRLRAIYCIIYCPVCVTRGSWCDLMIAIVCIAVLVPNAKLDACNPCACPLSTARKMYDCVRDSSPARTRWRLIDAPVLDPTPDTQHPTPDARRPVPDARRPISTLGFHYIPFQRLRKELTYTLDVFRLCCT